MDIWHWIVDDAARVPGARALPRARRRLLDRPEEARGLQPRQRHRDAARGRRDRAAGHPGAGTDQVDVLPAVPVCRRLRRRSAVLPGLEQGRTEADPVLADRSRRCACSCRTSAHASRGSTSDMRSASTPARRRSPHRSASRRTRSTGWGCHRSRRRRTWMRSRSVTRSPTFSARSARRSSSPQLGPRLIRRRSAGRLRRIREDRWAAVRRPTTPACSPRIARSRCAHTASTPESGLTGKPVRELFPGLRIFVERIHRGDEILEADAAARSSPATSSRSPGRAARSSRRSRR